MAIKKPASRKVSLVKNPPKGKLTVKRKIATTPKRTRKNPTPNVLKVRRRAVKRNPAPGELIGAFATALAINSFDLVINRFTPTLSGLVRTGAKFGGGWLVSKFGRKLPLIGKYSGILANALYLAGALDVVQTYVMPHVANLLMPTPPPVAVQKMLPSGELGATYDLPNGDQLIIVEEDDDSSESFNGYGVNSYAY